MIDRADLEQCESCEGFFDPEKMFHNNEGQSFCANCNEGITKDIRSTGIKHLDEYLDSRNLQHDFHVFSHAKWSLVTEEEFRELNEE